MKHKITLYQYEDCPFCIIVREKLEELGFEYDAIEVPRDVDSDIRRDLFDKSGVRTVPVIEIDGEFIGESEVIIKKLKTLKK